ncbi:MAG: hypothetical protein AAGA55_03525 [Planctomycetota bacterium]
MSLARTQLDAMLAAPADDAGGTVVRPETPHASGEVMPSSEIGTLSELLVEEHPRRSGGVVCPCCGTPTRRVVRVRPGGAGRWVAACAICAGKLLAGHPATLVGGAVRPRARRAG